jgi:hypothetical protein
MAATTPEERHAIAGRVAEMTALVERLLRGEITRTDAEIWAVHTARAHRGATIYTTPLPTDAAARSAVVLDLLDTLGLELSDLAHLPFEVDIPCWRLGRTDDNGQSATVALFRGYAKAAAALAAFEARAHKQTYWLERVEEP